MTFVLYLVTESMQICIMQENGKTYSIEGTERNCPECE
jgi:hypothetical protein